MKPDDSEIPVDEASQQFVDEFGNCPIHRIVQLKYFYKMIGACCGCNSVNTLVKSALWEDRNEGFFYKMPKRFRDGTPLDGTQDWLNRVFGQSWSFNDESDTCYMWNFYGPTKKNKLVQVSTTVRKLWDETKRSVFTPNERRFIYLRKVEYAPLPMIRSFRDIGFEEQAGSSPDHLEELYVKTLFLKNSPYSFEREVRLVQSFESGIEHRIDPLRANIYDYRISAIDMIEKVVASPFMNDADFARLCRIINRRSLLPLNILKRSSLFS